MRLFICLLVALFLLTPAIAEEIRLATWNIENLRDPGVASNKRKERDFKRLARYATEMDADIVALQEIESEAALEKIFDPSVHAFYMSTRNDTQRVALVVRNTVAVTHYAELSEFDTTGGVRHAVEMEITLGQQPIRLLAVHLKSFCFTGTLPAPDLGGNHCEKLATQIPLLEQWIDTTASDEVPFVVLGDFNRRLNLPNDAVWAELDDADPQNLVLHRASEGQLSRCWDGEYPEYIDHFVYNSQALALIEPASLKQIVYTEDVSLKSSLSDHCPLTIDLRSAAATKN